MKYLLTTLTVFLLAGGARSHEITPKVQADEVIAYIWASTDAQRRELRQETEIWAFVPPEGFAIVRLSQGRMNELKLAGLRVELNHERTLALHRPHEYLEGQSNAIPGFPCYRTVEETASDLGALATANPRLIARVDAGDSWEKTNGPGGGFDLEAWVLSNQDSLHPKAPFVIIAAMHAREYATAELATRFAEWLIAGYGTDADRTWILDHSAIHIVAQLNPDGRKKAETGLFWRKNVNNNHCTGSNDRGVDLNRNSTRYWGGGASSGSQCSETYRGPSVASEPETSAIENYIGGIFPDQRGPGELDAAPADSTGIFISIHSFGELILYPWEGDDSVTAPNELGLRTLGRKMGFSNGYQVCQTCLPPASGTTVDIAYSEYGVAAYTFEIGDTFFQNCTPFDITIFPENLEALFYAAKAARRPYQSPHGPDILSPDVVLAGNNATITAQADGTRYDSGGQGPVENPRVVSGASYSLDFPPWEGGVAIPFDPVDGTYDETVESLTTTIDLTTLTTGRHLVFLWADSSEESGVPTAVWLEVPSDEVFVDGFESGDTSAWSTVFP